MPHLQQSTPSRVGLVVAVDGVLHDLAFRERLDEPAAIGFGEDAGVEQDDDAVILPGANEAAEPLAQLDHGLGELVVDERIPPRGTNGFRCAPRM